MVSSQPKELHKEIQMTKTQTEQLAATRADKNVEVANLTVEQLEPLGYQERNDKARDIVKMLSGTAYEGVSEKYRNDFSAAYTNRILNIWGSKMKARENARRAFKSAAESMTTTQATEKLMAIAASFNLRGARVGDGSLEVMRGDRDGATLYWRLNADYDGSVRNPDDENQRVIFYNLELSISCCGTSYSTARMALVNKIQSELLEVANEIEATMSRQRIVSTWGIPETTTDVTATTTDAKEAK
jgi:hypothetical protein